jgi:hypothetical protein
VALSQSVGWGRLYAHGPLWTIGHYRWTEGPAWRDEPRARRVSLFVKLPRYYAYFSTHSSASTVQISKVQKCASVALSNFRLRSCEVEWGGGNAAGPSNRPSGSCERESGEEVIGVICLMQPNFGRKQRAGMGSPISDLFVDGLDRHDLHWDQGGLMGGMLVPKAFAVAGQ